MAGVLEVPRQQLSGSVAQSKLHGSCDDVAQLKETRPQRETQLQRGFCLQYNYLVMPTMPGLMASGKCHAFLKDVIV